MGQCNLLFDPDQSLPESWNAREDSPRIAIRGLGVSNVVQAVIRRRYLLISAQAEMWYPSPVEG